MYTQLTFHADPKIPAVMYADVLQVPTPHSTATRHIQQFDRSKFPLVVYSHGLGGMRSDNSSTCCDLASHGYLVAAVEHRYL